MTRHLRLLLVWLLCAPCASCCMAARLAAVGLLGASCASCTAGGVVRVEPGPAPAPAGFEPRIVVHVSGAGDVQSFIGAVPFSAFVSWSGKGTIEARLTPTGVVIFLDGDQSWVVTPAPGLESEAQKAVELGRIVITRNGAPVGLSMQVPAAPRPAPPCPISFRQEVCEPGGPCDLRNR